MATVPGFGNFTSSIDNVYTRGKRNVPSTGAFQFWTPFPVEDVPLEAGEHIMRFDADSDKTGWLFSLNYIDVERQVPTSVDDGVVPEMLGLTQNYSNPFNPQATIEYAVPAEGPVRVTVFDSRGRRVRTLVDERQSAGEHTVIWDGRDDEGNPLATGVYFHRLDAAGAARIGYGRAATTSRRVTSCR